MSFLEHHAEMRIKSDDLTFVNYDACLVCYFADTNNTSVLLVDCLLILSKR